MPEQITRAVHPQMDKRGHLYDWWKTLSPQGRKDALFGDDLHKEQKRFILSNLNKYEQEELKRWELLRNIYKEGIEEDPPGYLEEFRKIKEQEEFMKKQDEFIRRGNIPVDRTEGGMAGSYDEYVGLSAIDKLRQSIFSSVDDDLELAAYDSLMATPSDTTGGVPSDSSAVLNLLNIASPDSSAVDSSAVANLNKLASSDSSAVDSSAVTALLDTVRATQGDTTGFASPDSIRTTPSISDSSRTAPRDGFVLRETPLEELNKWFQGWLSDLRKDEEEGLTARRSRMDKLVEDILPILKTKLERDIDFRNEMIETFDLDVVTGKAQGHFPIDKANEIYALLAPKFKAHLTGQGPKGFIGGGGEGAEISRLGAVEADYVSQVVDHLLPEGVTVNDIRSNQTGLGPLIQPSAATAPTVVDVPVLDADPDLSINPTINTPLTNPLLETEVPGVNTLGYPLTGGDEAYNVPMDWQGVPDTPLAATQDLGDLLNLTRGDNLFQIPPHMSISPDQMGLFEDVPEDPSRLSRLWSHIKDNKAATAGWGLQGLSLLLKAFQGDNPQQKFAKKQMAYTSPYEAVPMAHGGVAGQQTSPLDSLRIGLKDAIVNSIDDPNREGKNSFVPSMLKAYDEIGKFGGEDVPAFAQGGVAKDNKIPAYAQGGVAGEPYMGGPTDGLVGEAGLEWLGREENSPIRGQALLDLINVDNPMAQFYNGGYAQNDIPAFATGAIITPQDADNIAKGHQAPPIRTAGGTGGGGNETNEFNPPVVGSEEEDWYRKTFGGASTVIDPSTQGSQGTILPVQPRQVDTRKSLQFREHHETLKEMLGAGGQSLGETSGQMAYGRGMAPLVMQSQWQDYEQDMRNRGMTFDQIMQQNRYNENQRQFATNADLQAQQIAGNAAANYNPYGWQDAIGDIGNIAMNWNAYRRWD